MNSYYTRNKEQIIQSKLQYCLESNEKNYFSFLLISVAIFCFTLEQKRDWKYCIYDLQEDLYVKKSKQSE